MTATKASVTTPPAGLARAVEERYGVRVARLAQLAGGETGETYAGGEIVVRWTCAAVDTADVEWEHGLVARLAAVVPEVVAPLRARDGRTWFEYDGRAASVYPLVAGTPARRDVEHAALAGAFVARLQRAAAVLDVGTPPRRPALASLTWAEESRKLPEPLVPFAREIAAARAEGVALIRDLAARGLAAGPIHGDLYPRNVLAERGRIVGLVDWAEARVDWLAYDVANALWEFCRVDDELVEEHVQAFLDAYAAAGGPEYDHDVLMSLIRVRRAVEIMVAARGDADDAAYTLHNLRALELLR